MTDIDAFKQICDVYNRGDKFEELKVFIKSLMELFPKDAYGYDSLSYAYFKAKDYKTAIKYGELALGAANEQEAKAIRFNLGKCYLNANEPYKSRHNFQILADLEPENLGPQIDLSAAMYACNDKEAANNLLLEIDKEGWKLNEKDNISVQFNLGTHYIRHGDLRKGLQLLGMGRANRIWGSSTHEFIIPEWDGITYPGKHILMVGEGGIGDEIINARFVRHIQERGMKCSFASCHGMSSVFSRLPFDKTQNYTKFTSDVKDILDYNYYVPAMDVPRVLSVDFPDLWNGPYLTVDPAYNEKWKSKLTGDFKVGLRWSGNPLYEQDLHRTLDLNRIYKCLPKEWTKYSIQKENTEILNNYTDIIPLENDLETFEDALACINNLDLVITSCTSVAHAAAALGKQVIILIPIMEYFIWCENKSKSSWYGDNVTLIRQTVPKSWDSAYEELNTHLIGLQK